MKPKIRLNAEKTKQLKEVLWQARSRFTADAYERSDLIYCPVKGYNRMHKVRAKIPMHTAAIWVIGEALHIAIQKAFTETEVTKELLPKTNFRFDLLWGKPTEIKTTRSTVFRPSHIPKAYLDQLECGLACLDENIGHLITLDITNALLLVWDIEWSKEYLAKRRAEYLGSLHSLDKAVSLGLPHLLKPKIEECPSCIYFLECPYLRS